jgi:hypothetical protein
VIKSANYLSGVECGIKWGLHAILRKRSFYIVALEALTYKDRTELKQCVCYLGNLSNRSD